MPRAKNEDGAAIVKSASTRRRSTSAAGPDVTGAKPPVSANPNPTLPVSETPRNAEEEIRRRAYELYEQDGRQDGRDHEHWLRAEAEVLGRSSGRRGQKSA
jgi:hypothetical protein